MYTPEITQPKLLYVETYPTGSHGRILDLLKKHSALRIGAIRCEREHWRWLAISAHYEVLGQFSIHEHDPPQMIVCSGPMNVSALSAMLPETWRHIPIVVYFHESQWTYPSERYDPRPYLLAHLDTAGIADEVWFNSRFHLETFWAASTSAAASRRIRKLAQYLRPILEPKCRVIYPPVELESFHDVDDSLTRRRRIIWNARWERDKRPDRFVQLLDRLALNGQSFDVVILGTGNADADAIATDLALHAERTLLPGHLGNRADYETVLATGDIFVSTADHEFFGVAALEGALSGVIPVLPNALAYPETIPSAYFYIPGDIDDLASVVMNLLHTPPQTVLAQQSDAARFLPTRVVPVFDEHCLRVISNGPR